MKKPRRKRKPLVVWGVVDRKDAVAGAEITFRAAHHERRHCENHWPDDRPFRVVKFVEVVR